jgi:hypothetical protein
LAETTFFCFTGLAAAEVFFGLLTVFALVVVFIIPKI